MDGPGSRDITATFTIDLHGRFEKGRWINDATPLFDYFRGLPQEKPKFNIKAKYKLDFFDKGIYTHSEDKEKDFGDFVLGEMVEMVTW